MQGLTEIEGQWWIPASPEARAFGMLRDDPDGGVTLTTWKPVTATIGEILGHQGKLVTSPVICGLDRDAKPVTLLYCMERESNMSLGMVRQRFDSRMALLGYEAATLDAVRFRRVVANFTHFQAWLSLSCIERGERPNGGTTVSVCYPEDLVFPLSNGAEIRLRAHLSFDPWRVGESRFGVTEERLLQVAFAEPRELNDFIEWLTRFRWLLSLLIGEPVELRAMNPVLPHEPDANAPETSIESLGHHICSELPKREARVDRMLVRFADVRAEFADLVNRWFDYYAKIEPALNLYFAVRFNSALYINNRFLFLAQALEAYHRANFDGRVMPKADFRARRERILAACPAEDAEWLRKKLQHANEKSLAARLTDILTRYPDEAKAIVGDTAKFAEDVKHTRNFYTHFSDDLRDSGKVVEEHDLYPLIEKMQRLLEVCFLRDLGLHGEAVRKVVRRPLPMLVHF